MGWRRDEGRKRTKGVDGSEVERERDLDGRVVGVASGVGRTGTVGFEREWRGRLGRRDLRRELKRDRRVGEEEDPCRGRDDVGMKKRVVVDASSSEDGVD